MVALGHEQVAVGAAQRPDVLAAAAFEALEQVLAKARVAAHPQPARLPDDGQVARPQRDEPVARARLAEGLRADRGHLVEQRGRLEEVAVGRREVAEDLRGEIAGERVGLAARAGDVLGRAPRLEEHAGHPAAGDLHRVGLVDGVDAPAGQRLSGLRLGERERALADRGCTPEGAGGPQVELHVDAADEHDAHGGRRVAHEGGEDGERLRSVRELLQLVDDE